MAVRATTQRRLRWAGAALLAIDPRIPRADQVYTFRIVGGRAVRSVTWILDGHVLGRTRALRIAWPLACGPHQLAA